MIHKGCIIVPYRDREDHLKTFIPYMVNYLKESNLDLSIFIIEQTPGKPFNRAKLFNVGVDIISQDFNKLGFTYYIFHDVDMLPITAYYNYPLFPTHIATRCSQFGYKMPSPDYFGGVTLINREHFTAINGFSNNFWGWGAEDDEIRNRFTKKKIRIQRRQCTFESLPHDRPVDWQKYHELVKAREYLPPPFVLYQKNLELARNIDFKEGLSTVRYNLLDTSELVNYRATKYVVEI